MVTIQIHDTGQELESKDASITYVKTAGDLGSLTSVNSSYSWSMKFPKTPKNTQVLDGLGLVGSGSNKPYEKVYCNLLENGIPITVKGLLNIKETSDNYGLFIQEGFIDFLKDITNDTIGDAIDLTALNHTRDYNTIVDSFDLELPYVYLIADVNGGYFLNESGTTNLDPNYMTPYANVGYLWDLIFSTYGWTFNFNSTVRYNIDTLWMSYPSEIVFGDEDATQAGVFSVASISLASISSTRFLMRFTSLVYDGDYVMPTNVSGSKFTIKENGVYKVTFGSVGTAIGTNEYGTQKEFIYRDLIAVNGVLTLSGNYGDDSDEAEGQLTLNEGDEIEFICSVYDPDRGSVGRRGVPTATYDLEVHIDEANMQLDYLVQGEVNFTQALVKYKISDFIKEVMTREALTPYVDADNKSIEFLTLKERVNYTVKDWSRWYSKRLSETYLYRDYDQNNYMRHKYDEEGEDFNDGNIQINNLNLDTEKTIYQSNSFSPSQELSTFVDAGGNYKVPRLPMFDAEVKDDEGAITIEYKFIKDRFFFVNHAISSREIYIDTNLVEGFPMVSVYGSVFKDIVNTKYLDFTRMTDSAKVHNIELALPLSEVVTLDLRQVFYFEQEAAFYILNKLTYKTGEKSKAEFLKIDREFTGASDSDGAFSNAFNNSFNN